MAERRKIRRHFEFLELLCLFLFRASLSHSCYDVAVITGKQDRLAGRVSLDSGNTRKAKNEELISSLAGDSSFAPVLRAYRVRLNTRITELRRAVQAASVDELRFQVHQIKGSAGSFGFAPITQAARRCEGLLQNDVSIDDAQEALTDLLRLMEAASLAEGGTV